MKRPKSRTRCRRRRRQSPRASRRLPGYCANCHGLNAEGGPGNDLTPPAPDLTGKEWKHGSTDGEIFTSIKNGVPPDFNMGAFGDQLKDEEIWNVVNYVGRWPRNRDWGLGTRDWHRIETPQSLRSPAPSPHPESLLRQRRRPDLELHQLAGLALPTFAVERRASRERRVDAPCPSSPRSDRQSARPCLSRKSPSDTARATSGTCHRPAPAALPTRCPWHQDVLADAEHVELVDEVVVERIRAR